MGRERRVRSVVVLTGLPREVFASTCAHELGHVFLHLTPGFEMAGDLAPVVAEGFCELLGYLWLTEGAGRLTAPPGPASTHLPSPPPPQPRAPISTNPDSNPERVRSARLKAMVTNTDRIYGDGLRNALSAYYACGNSIGRLLDEMRRCRTFPSNGRLASGNSPARSKPAGTTISSPDAHETSPALGQGARHVASTAAGGAAAAAALLAGGSRQRPSDPSSAPPPSAFSPAPPEAAKPPTGFGRAVYGGRGGFGASKA